MGQDPDGSSPQPVSQFMGFGFVLYPGNPAVAGACSIFGALMALKDGDLPPADPRPGGSQGPSPLV